MSNVSLLLWANIVLQSMTFPSSFVRARLQSCNIVFVNVIHITYLSSPNYHQDVDINHIMTDFCNLPKGVYYLLCFVLWKVPDASHLTFCTFVNYLSVNFVIILTFFAFFYIAFFLFDIIMGLFVHFFIAFFSSWMNSTYIFSSSHLI